MRLLFFLILISFHASCQEKGKVVKVADGDTFTMLENGRQIRVRLYGVDAPEKGQDFSNVSREFLARLVMHQDVVLERKSVDQFRRIVAIVRVGDTNVNEELLEHGYAWHFKRYDNNPRWSALEQTARSLRRGLWAGKNPVAPWQFRKK